MDPTNLAKTLLLSGENSLTGFLELLLMEDSAVKVCLIRPRKEMMDTSLALLQKYK